MWLLEIVFDLLAALGNYHSPNWKPRRVFTRGFVAFCVFVAVFELFALNMMFGGHR
ncbi:hypothetical protein G3435_15695 [Pseudomonas sp. MAFF212428]|uniref:Uncharacterized protein n=1 Tax=Pseudomonas brassicae TaxID=2708063 RepID=A0A6B3NQI2_9PSED|nr:hypothetical protein [Pseudomonas brassicae]NER61021.1 hypothetical protein [Pseudomonas brassicae]NER64136.1 hypothetical protein [Pseudomonas brassicae]